MPGTRRPSVTIVALLVTGIAMPIWSISCMAPCPSSLSGAEPEIESSGASEYMALLRPGMPLANPGVV